MKKLDEESIMRFLEMDFRKDSENHDVNWYIERVPNSFYTEKDKSTSDTDIFNLNVYYFHTAGMEHGFYCKPSWDWINPLSDYLKGKKVLDTMTGNGLIPLCLKHRGIDIDACDRVMGDANEYTTYRCWDFPIISGEKYIKEQAKNGIIYDTILLIWPEYDGDGTDKEICDVFLKYNPNGEIIFIGEDCGGCTGSYEFFNSYELEIIKELDSHYTPDCGMHDGIYRVVKSER